MTATPLSFLTKSHLAASLGRRLARADSRGWGALALTVLIGALSYGPRGAWVMSGLFTLVVGVIATARGRVDWARLRGRGAGGLVLFAGLLITLVAGLARTPPAETDNAIIVTPPVATSSRPIPATSPPAPSAGITSEATDPAGTVGPSRTRLRVGRAPARSTYVPGSVRAPAPAQPPAPAPAPDPRPAPATTVAPTTTPAPTSTTTTTPAPTPTTTTTTTTATTTAAANGTTTLPHEP